MSYEVDFDNLKELVNKIFKNAKIDRAEAKSNQEHDSSLFPDGINIKDKTPDGKDKKKPDASPNRDAIPTEE